MLTDLNIRRELKFSIMTLEIQMEILLDTVSSANVTVLKIVYNSPYYPQMIHAVSRRRLRSWALIVITQFANRLRSDTYRHKCINCYHIAEINLHEPLKTVYISVHLYGVFKCIIEKATKLCKWNRVRIIIEVGVYCVKILVFRK